MSINVVFETNLYFHIPEIATLFILLFYCCCYYYTHQIVHLLHIIHWPRTLFLIPYLFLFIIMQFLLIQFSFCD